MEYNGVDVIIAIWSGIIFIFGIIEMVKLTGDFFHFSLGGLAALICYFLGFELLVQVIAFVAVAGVSFLLLRPLFIRLADRNATAHEVGLDLLVGLEGLVISKVDMDAGTGRVDINGRPVKAVPVDPSQKYNVGDRVVATGLDGDHLIVKKARKRTK